MSRTSRPVQIVVIGGTRGTGRHIVQRLVEQGTPVRVVARRPERARRVLPASVEIVRGDLTRPGSLPPAMADARALIVTAGCRSGLPAREAHVRATEYDGIRNIIDSTRRAGFQGRLLYMTSSGVTRRSLATMVLNIYKGNTLRWRRRAEEEIRASGIDYTIVRAGFLLNARGGEHAIRVTQEALPLSVGFRIARTDVAEVFVTALDEPRASRATFDVVWEPGPRTELVSHSLRALIPDELRTTESRAPGRSPT